MLKMYKCSAADELIPVGMCGYWLSRTESLIAKMKLRNSFDGKWHASYLVYCSRLTDPIAVI